MKICHGCSTQLANAVKTCKSCGADFRGSRQLKNKSRSMSAPGEGGRDAGCGERVGKTGASSDG